MMKLETPIGEFTTDSYKIPAARSVLTAAALTYVAALAASILQLLRLIILAGGRDRD